MLTDMVRTERPRVRRPQLARIPIHARLVGLVVVGLAIFAVATGLSCARADARLDPTPLFNDVTGGPSIGAGDPTVKRARVVTVNFDVLKGQLSTMSGSMGVAGSLTLNLFPDTELTASLDFADGSMNTPAERLTWVGHVDGAPEDRVLLVAGDGTLAGSIQTRQGLYEIRYLGEGNHTVVEVDRAQFGPD